MRTTLTIEDSILQALKKVAHQKGLPLKRVVNTTLELGLRQLNEKPKKGNYRLKTYPMGHPPRVNLDKALGVASNLEDEETLRKLEINK